MRCVCNSSSKQASDMLRSIYSCAWMFFVALLLDFRASVLKARQGRLPFPPGSVTTTASAWNLVGGIVSSSILAFAFVSDRPFVRLQSAGLWKGALSEDM